MPIVRTYQCDDCSERLGKPFTFDKLHFDRSEDAPECPGCAALASKQVPASFSIGGGTISKAADIMYDIASKDYGMTDMKDSLREGDIAAPSLPAHLAPAAKNFWSASGPIIAAAKQGAQLAKAEGSNPLTLVQRARKMKAG